MTNKSDTHSKNNNSHAGRVIDLNHILTHKAQEAARSIKRQQKIMIDNSFANHAAQLRAHHAGLLIMAAKDRNEICHAITDHLPTILELDSAHLAATQNSVVIDSPWVVAIDPDHLEKLVPESRVFLGPPNPLQAESFRLANAKPPPSIAAIRIPDDLPASIGDHVLMLGGASADSFTALHGVELLTRLAETIAVALAARGNDPKDNRSP